MTRKNLKIISFRIDPDLQKEFNNAVIKYRRIVQQRYKYAFVTKSSILTDCLTRFIDAVNNDNINIDEILR